MFQSLIAIAVGALFSLPLARGAATPTANVKNGTYAGKYVAEWEQDQFLGIPFAQPPVGALRFARPKSIVSAFNGTKLATEYGYSCYQYSNPTFNLSEDCLTLNGIGHLITQNGIFNII